MQAKNGIFIKNVYYMLAYAFKSLKHRGFANIQPEKFDSIWDLIAVILSNGIKFQVQKDVSKEYLLIQENLSSPKGKICFKENINNFMCGSNKLFCEFDELSENVLLNQILKSAVLVLMRSDKVKYSKSCLKRVLIYFDNVNEIDLKTVQWQKLQFDRQTENYKMLVNLCYLVAKCMIWSTESGKFKLPNFVDEKSFHSLFQAFVLNYYATHFRNAGAPKIKWFLTEGVDDNLPEMRTDIVLSAGNKRLIIDTKYYAESMNHFFDKDTFHSANLYQIFTYVKNMDCQNSGDVAGMLLYAKTPKDRISQLSRKFKMGQNQIYIESLDLSKEFKIYNQEGQLQEDCIVYQLDEIVYRHFGKIKKYE